MLSTSTRLGRVVDRVRVNLVRTLRGGQSGLPVGLLDRFVVTGWSPPAGGEAELEVLHLGPYFTGEGVFHLTLQGSLV